MKGKAWLPRIKGLRVRTVTAARAITVVRLSGVVFSLQVNGPLEDAHDLESQRCGYGMIVIFEAEERFGFVYWWLEARSTTVMEYFIT